MTKKAKALIRAIVVGDDGNPVILRVLARRRAKFGGMTLFIAQVPPSLLWGCRHPSSPYLLGSGETSCKALTSAVTNIMERGGVEAVKDRMMKAPHFDATTRWSKEITNKGEK